VVTYVSLDLDVASLEVGEVGRVAHIVPFVGGFALGVTWSIAAHATGTAKRCLREASGGAMGVSGGYMRRRRIPGHRFGLTRHAGGVAWAIGRRAA
jgi:hypothetical protein